MVIYRANTRYIINKTYRSLLPPMLLSSTTMTVMTITDMALSSVFCGPEGLAVVTMFFPLLYCWDCLAAFFGCGSTTLFSVAKGEKNRERAQEIFSSSVTTTLITTFLFAMLFVVWNPVLLSVLGFSVEMRSAAAYGQWFAISMAVSIMAETLVSFINADSSPKFAFYCSLSQAATNLVLDVVFMGILKTGIVGAVYAFTIASTMAVLLAGGYFLLGKTTLKLRFSLMDRKTFISTLNLSYHMIVENLGVGLFGLILNHLLLGVFGLKGIVIYGVLNAVNALRTVVAETLGRCSALISGMFLGERDLDGIRIATRTGAFIALALGGSSMILLLSFPQTVIFIFDLDQPEFFQECVWAIRLYALSSIFFFLNDYWIVFLQTMGKSGLALMLSIVHAVVLPLLVAVIMLRTVSSHYYWSFFAVYEFICFLAIIAITLSKWRQIKKELNCETFRGCSFLLLRDTSKLIESRDRMSEYLQQWQVPESTINTAMLTFEEIGFYAMENSLLQKNNFLDMRLYLFDDELRISIRYDGYMDRLDDLIDHGDPARYVGLRILRKLSDRFYFDRICCFNYMIASVKIK